MSVVPEPVPALAGAASLLRRPAPPVAALLSNGGYSTLVTAGGTGLSTFGAHALTRWAGDPIVDGDGFLVWLVDRERDALWSVAAAPCAPRTGAVRARFGPGAVEFSRVEHEIEARLAVAVHPTLPLEIRRITLSHDGPAARTIEIAVALEVVLHDRAADASHPAFSRLFVQTEWSAADGALLARRRPRGAGEKFPWMGLAVLEDRAVEFESDRAKFLGRVPDRTRPRALASAAPWSSTVGNVLDPVLALRVTRTVKAGAPVTLTFALVAGEDRAAVLAALARARGEGGASILSGARSRGNARRDEVAGLGAIGFAGEAAPVDGVVEIAAAPVLADESSVSPSANHDRDRTAAAALEAAFAAEPLEFWNGSGGFASAGREYVVRFGGGLAATRPPQPWINVIASEDFGGLVSETGAGATWSVNSRERRLSPWSNDALLDPPGEALWLRDDIDGAIASPLPGPVGPLAPGATGDPCEARHGFGVTRFRRTALGLSCNAEVFVPRHDPVKIVRVTVTNPGGAARHLVLASYQQLVLGGLPTHATGGVVTEAASDGTALYARRPGDALYGGRVAFTALIGEAGASANAFTCDRAAFLGGPGEGLAAPRGLTDPAGFDGRTGDDLDPCFAQAVGFMLAPGASATWTIVFGDAFDRAAADALLAHYRTPGATEAALAAMTTFWETLVGAVQVTTPAPALDRMINGWALYQTIACRLWGRTAFAQSGGAYGFRDQLQDSSALLHSDPAMFRAQIVRNARHQFETGDVLHWWHPPDARGLRTRFADDLLWLPWLAATYVAATGDATVLDEVAPFVVARELEPGEQEVFLAPTISTASASVYEHCLRAIERSLTVGNGAHGLPLFGCGDWNDGMNRVGHDGKGESTWMAMFLHAVLTDFTPLVRARGDLARAERYDLERVRLVAALESAGWDGAWYRRGYYDDGTPLGTAQGDECRIDALAQAWATIADTAPAPRAESALDAVEEHLISDEAGIIRLLDPPFENTPNDPGYIKGYVRGVRENGGQYTHAALWVVRAFAERGRRDRAAHLLELLSPVSHSQTPAQVATYQVEPYVVAADVYGAEPHVGRGGWTWYTGSAGWLLRVALESVLGVTIDGGDTLVVKPCIPDDWPGYTVRRRLPDGTTYVIDVRGGLTAAGSGKSAASEIVSRAAVDGSPTRIVDGAARIPLARDGREHAVTIQLGPRA